MRSPTPEQRDSTATRLALELEAERRRNLELAARLQTAEAARVEAAALLIRATNERARLRRLADLADREAAAARRTASAAIAARDVVLASTTWRATYPVRYLAGRLPRGVRRAIRGGAKLVQWTLTFRLVRELRSRGLLRPARTQPRDDRRPFDLAPPVLAPPVDPATRRESVDIIVHALGDPAAINACLAALIQFTLPPYRVILVNDGTNYKTEEFLRRAANEQGFILRPTGNRNNYAVAANTAIRESDSAWIVLLNSDMVVSPDWLDRMWAHAAADAKIGIIGPLANTASWQSVRDVTIGLPGFDSSTGNCGNAEMARIAAGSGRGVLLMPFLDGFCYMIRRVVIDQIGLFDELISEAGDAAVHDFSIRARQAGWKLVVASDVYIHRLESKGDAETDSPAPALAFEEALARKHDPKLHIRPQVVYCNENLPMHALRARLRGKLLAARLSEEGRRRFEGLRVAFVLSLCNGSSATDVVLQKARALERIGVSVTLLHVRPSESGTARSEPLGMPEQCFETPHLLTLYLHDVGDLYDVVVATGYRAVHWMPPSAPNRRPKYVYLAQDFEPAYLSEDDPEYLLAARSYNLHSEIKFVTTSCWTQAQLLQRTSNLASRLELSVEIDPFGPADERMPGQPLGPVSIVANLRPSERRSGAERTIDVLEQVARMAECPISVQVFGANDSELADAGLARSFLWNFGELSRDGRARLLSYADIFVDLADYQPVGLTALEAMLSGAAIVVPAIGAASDFVQNGSNGVLAQTTNRSTCLEQILHLVRDARLRRRLQIAAITGAHGLVPERSAVTFLETVAADA
ncbi:MAG: glycosyltransferase [Alphaproteobacteria bacterium]